MKNLITALTILCCLTFVSAQQTNSNDEIKSLNVEVVKLYEAQKYEEALPLAKKAISLSEKKLGKNHLSIASPWRNLAYIQAQLGKKKDAGQSFENALSIYESNKPLSPKDEQLYAEMFEAVGTYDALGGNLVSAEQRFSKAVELREKGTGSDSSYLANALSKLAEIYQFQTQYEKAEPLMERALELSAKNNKLSEQGESIYDSLDCLYTKLDRLEEQAKMRVRYYPVKKTKDEEDKAKEIKGGVINGKALDLPKPPYPAEAREKRLTGEVSVRVLIDENGKVLSACAIKGAREFHRVAEWAALQAKFSPTTLAGKPVKVSGVIVYKFVP
ncbi:MAG: TonB family protein [Pyrinomonadaceae bacterium]|nr:TonB family protein [Pyrinomonadaceae bacterium]